MRLLPLIKTALTATVLTAVSTVSFAQADANKALLDALIKKGILTNDEANQISAEVAKSSKGYDVITTPADGFIKKLTLTGRFQVQFADFGTSIDGNPISPVSTERFMLRRIYLGTRVDLAGGFYGAVTYDFANDSFDKALLGWKQSDALTLEAGITKAPFGYEEMTSSGSLKAIERSPLTRYIDEPNNGRRLGAASYRIGIFASGTEGLFFYNVAATNPDRNEYSGDGTSGPTINGQSAVNAAAGTASDNSVAFYGTAGIGDKFTGGTYKLGLEGGYVPDQGGPGATIGQGNGITLAGVYGDITYGGFELIAEYEEANDHHGVNATTSATPKGFYIQPSFYVIPKILEGVFRYSNLDSDGRGVALSDGIRSAVSGGTMNKMSEIYIGANWYLAGPDFKLQAGYIHGESKDTVTGLPAKAKTDGFRSQVQVNF